MRFEQRPASRAQNLAQLLAQHCDGLRDVAGLLLRHVKHAVELDAHVILVPLQVRNRAAPFQPVEEQLRRAVGRLLILDSKARIILVPFTSR